MVRSKEYVTPSKSPDDQITEFQNGMKHFWPYDTTAAGGSSTPYMFKKAPNPTFVQSLKAKHDRDSDEWYVTHISVLSSFCLALLDIIMTTWSCTIS
jgi:hypothetical protein